MDYMRLLKSKYAIEIINLMDTPIEKLLYLYSLKYVFESCMFNGYVIRIYELEDK